MAEYTFRCRKCMATVKIDHPMVEPHPTHHENCGGELIHVFDSQGDVIYRSTGFTRTNRRFEISPKDI